MAICTCRVCGRELFYEPLLHYTNMPKAAQHLPDMEALKDDAGVDMEVCQCRSCGLVQLTNEPVPYYREVIRAAGVSGVVRDFKTKQLADLFGKYSLHRRKVLEIGCGRGEFLSILSQLDVDAYGLEYSKEAVAECKRNGLHVSRGYPDRDLGLLANGPFEFFLLSMFLEHMPNPNEALWAIHENLANAAIGLIEVPNFDMVLRNSLFSEFTADHLLYFTKHTLQTTLALNGFDVLDYDELRNDYVIAVTVRKRNRLDVSHFNDFQNKIKTDIEEYFDLFKPKRVAVWGAGHQALATIALTGIANRIRYVIDSAPFKQGKYTPVTHVPIVAPESLHSDPVDAVIIMAASYSDEVARIIRDRFSTNMPVAILRDFGLELF